MAVSYTEHPDNGGDRLSNYAGSQLCNYCNKIINDDNYLTCMVCQKDTHVKCLQHACTPGDLAGDVFFDFTCAHCNATTPSTSKADNEYEQCVRQHLSWMMVVTLTLYNLSIKSKGLSHHGYFHWRTHIISFINKNWQFFFAHKTHRYKRKRKNWIGSISSTLSVNNPEFFQSGQDIFNESGWWKLRHQNHTPRYIFNLYHKSAIQKQQKRQERRLQDEQGSGSDSTQVNQIEAKRMRYINPPEDIPESYGCARVIPYMGCKPKPSKQLNVLDDDLNKEQCFNNVQSSLMDFLAENLGGDDLSMLNSFPNIEQVEADKHDFLMSPSLLDISADSIIPFDMSDMKLESTNDGPLNKLYHEYSRPQNTECYQITESSATTPSEFNSSLADDDNVDDLDEDEEEIDIYQPRIVQVTNFQQKENSGKQNDLGFLRNEQTESHQCNQEKNDGEYDASEKMKSSPAKAMKATLFTKEARRNWPWLLEKTFEESNEGANDINTEENNKSLKMLSNYEERQLLQKLKKIFSLKNQCNIQIPLHIRVFYRKLCVRQWKREHNRPVFNLDELLDRNFYRHNTDQSQVLDRFQLIMLSKNDKRKSFYARLMGIVEYERFESPYTKRILCPFIFRSTDTLPPWLKLMCELQKKVTGEIPDRETIDYCYVRANHIPAINALLQSEFWPGIDMSDCLSYPDFTVVALYKKLIIGCGFLVPDVGFNEAYISYMAVRPGWQRSGIATFMLYHLIQTCMTKDITLHVSATNPAIVLYQKFGFQIKDLVLDFYDKYLPFDSPHSRHAFFLRLVR